MITLPERLSLAQLPTPLQLLKVVSDDIGVRIWIKRDDLTGITLTGNKVRKLEFTLAKALSEGCDAIITCGGLQSNHCRATAFACARLGLHTALLLRGEPQGDWDGNLLLGKLAGAEIDTYRPSVFRSQLSRLLEEKAQQLRCQGKIPFIIPTGASDGNGIWGYVAACQELQADFSGAGINPDYIVCASGSGGTQAGLTLGTHLLNMAAQVIGFAVCDDESYFQAKVRADIRQWQQWYDQQVDMSGLDIRVNDHYIGPGYARADAEVFDTIAWLARSEGVLLDPVYTGKAFHGLLQEIKKGNMSTAEDIVFIHTGGIFGNFPQKAGFRDC